MGRAREVATKDRGAYTPTWTGSTTNPAIGNGTITGRYMRDGKTVTATINIVAGSTTTFGSGNWLFTLPFTADTTVSSIGSAQIFDASTGTIYVGAVVNINSTTMVLYSHNTTAAVGAAVPMTWANSDALRLTFTYEAA
jgi:hypothetical protein